MMNREKLYRRIKPIFVRLNSHKSFYACSRTYYRAAFKIFVFVLKRFQNIQFIYSRGSFAEGGWIPWESDIDVTLIIEDMEVDQEVRFLRRFWLVYRCLNIFFPFIRHLDVFNKAEFNLNVQKDRWVGDYFRTDLKWVYGKDGGNIACASLDKSFRFRVGDWKLFMGFVYEDNLNEILYVRKYQRFFNSILLYGKERSPYENNLRELLSEVETSGQWLKNPEDFVMKGFYASLLILDDVYKHTLAGHQDVAARRQAPGPGRRLQSSSKQSTELIEALTSSQYPIKSIFIDAGSTRNSYPRTWILLDQEIAYGDFASLVNLVKKHSPSYPANMTYILTEHVLNLFTTTQRAWAFESYHLSRHAEIHFGEDLSDSLQAPSSETMTQMARNSVIVYKAWLRGLMYKRDVHTYRRFVVTILSWKLFFKKNIIATTFDELAVAYKELSSQDGVNELELLLNRKSIHDPQTYALLKSIVTEFSESIGLNDL